MINTLYSTKLFWPLLVTFVLLNGFDAHSTYLVMRPYHYHRERNPVARWAFRKMGIPRGIIVFKMVLLAILIPAMIFYSCHDVFTINIVLLVSNLIFLAVVVHNYRVYRKIHKQVEI